MKKAAVLLIIILLLFSLTACMPAYIFSSIYEQIYNRQTKPMVSAVKEYLTNNTLPDEYVLDFYRLDPHIEYIGVIKSKTGKEFLHEKDICQDTENDSGNEPSYVYTSAQYFDGKKLFIYDGKSQKPISKSAQWEDFDYDNIPDIIRLNIKEIIKNVKVINVSYFTFRPVKGDLYYQITITYNERQINRLKIFDEDISYFEIIGMINKEGAPFGNITVSFGNDTSYYIVTFGEVKTSPDDMTLKEQFDSIVYGNEE
ncbi:MAG: hypothetical protein GYA50_01010 [Eubacteriaceae bacterium]|nr:hypothetical protein [Eubacteriaceae bacterium]